MSASLETECDFGWTRAPSRAGHWDELPTDGAHAWLGFLLVLGSSIVTVRGLCWLAATAIRLCH